MKKIMKAFIGSAVLVVMVFAATAVSFAEEDTDVYRATVDFRAASPEGYDCVYNDLETASILFGFYFPELEQYDVKDGVSFADALVAAHVKKYGPQNVTDHLDFAYNDAWGTIVVNKQFDHEYCGIYVMNNNMIPVVCTSQEVGDGDTLFAGSYGDFNYSDCYGKFDSTKVTMAAGADIEEDFTAVTGEGSEVIPANLTLKEIDPETGALTDVPGAAYNNGTFSFTFQDRGVHYVTAVGSVTYQPSWSSESVTGQVVGGFLPVIVAPMDEVTVNFSAGIPGSFDYLNEKLKVSGDDFEWMFPDLAKYDDVDGVSFADAIVAAHLQKYAWDDVEIKQNLKFEYNDSWGLMTVAKQFGHDINGFYYQNNAAIPVVATSQKIAGGDRLFAGSYTDYNYSDLFSFFSKKTVTTVQNKTVTVDLKCDNNGTAIAPATATIMTVNKKTGKMTALKGAKFSNGKVTFKFAKVGTYYVGAKGTVKYTTSWNPDEVTGAYAGALVKVTVKYAKPARPVFKSVKRNTKKKATVVWKKAKNAKKYQLQYRMKGKKKWITKKTAKTRFVLRKLKAKKAYQVRVRAINGTAKSKYSKIRVIKKK